MGSSAPLLAINVGSGISTLADISWVPESLNQKVKVMAREVNLPSILQVCLHPFLS